MSRLTRSDAGMATAELALAMPALVLVTGAVLYSVAALGLQLRCVDAARAGVRAQARGDSAGVVAEAVAATAPHGAQSQMSETVTDVSVRVTVRLPGSGALGLASFVVGYTALAARERPASPADANAGPEPP